MRFTLRTAASLFFCFLHYFNLFLSFCDSRRAFNWPVVPNVKEDVLNERLYTAVLVIFLKCGESLKKSYIWEKK